MDLKLLISKIIRTMTTLVIGFRFGYLLRKQSNIQHGHQWIQNDTLFNNDFPMSLQIN
jgi:hypothetical protein